MKYTVLVVGFFCVFGKNYAMYSPRELVARRSFEHDCQMLAHQISDHLDGLTSLLTINDVPAQATKQVQITLWTIRYAQRKIEQHCISEVYRIVEKLCYRLETLYGALVQLHWPSEQLKCIRYTRGELNDALTDYLFLVWLHR